jgi:hypothetical protein
MTELVSLLVLAGFLIGGLSTSRESRFETVLEICFAWLASF